MNKKKLLVIHPALAPYRVDFFNSLSEAFVAKYYFFNSNLMNQKFDQKQLQKQLNFKCNYLRKGLNFKGRSLRFGVTKIILNNNPDIIICPEYNPIILLVLSTRFIFNKKFKIHTICDDSLESAINVSFFKKHLRSFLLKRLDGVILTNNTVKEYYLNKLEIKTNLLIFPIIRREDKYILQLKASIETSKKYIKQYNLENKKTFLFVGRLVKIKNIERLLEAFKPVVANYNDVRLIIVGSGEEQSFIKEKIVSLNLENNVVLPGRFEGTELLAWYLTAGVFILPSTSEVFGAVINEALLAGCYVLTSDLAGGASLIRENINGNKFNPYDVNGISNIILTTLLNDNNFRDLGSFKKSRMNITYKDTFNTLIENL
ncbi:Glycosyltransferase involved in cell wall bisynthesis [Arenibacter nanhaiticus]|uniref:Glycosyltransferase involved in cell wall bisynthesis n=1 Tax=Arenibacter nanhaiticus TaxID=558155 RepID=A0A1M6LYZ6_9FLAO|nr:glycosyltransferase [Arenibacter nanhaiticus]SHJ76293.1 Glycosyltransferase involved in cell wall bisynthesis [Arenibacter nanhaiticus]